MDSDPFAPRPGEEPCGGTGNCAIGFVDLGCSNCERQVRLDAIEARARGDYETERKRLDTLALMERT